LRGGPLPVRSVPAGDPARPVRGASAPGEAAGAGRRESATAAENEAESQAPAERRLIPIL